MFMATWSNRSLPNQMTSFAFTAKPPRTQSLEREDICPRITRMNANRGDFRLFYSRQFASFAGPPLLFLAALRCFSFAVIALCAQSLVAAESKISASDLQFFEGKIRPIFSDNCYKCHSAGAEKIKGGLLLDTRDGALKGGNTGPAVVPGNLEKSLLIKAVHYTDKDLQMPPNDRKLSDAQ